MAGRTAQRIDRRLSGEDAIGGVGGEIGRSDRRLEGSGADRCKLVMHVIAGPPDDGGRIAADHAAHRKDIGEDKLGGAVELAPFGMGDRQEVEIFG